MGNLLKKLAVPIIATSLLLAPKIVEAQNYPVTLSAGIGTNTFTDLGNFGNSSLLLPSFKVGAGISLAKNKYTNFELYYLSQTASTPVDNNSYIDTNLNIFLFDFCGKSNLFSLDATTLYGLLGATVLAGKGQVTIFGQGQIQNKISSDLFGWGYFFGAGIDIAFSSSLSLCLESRIRHIATKTIPSLWGASVEVGTSYNL